MLILCFTGIFIQIFNFLGARFRYLNEQIYKRESNEANKLFKEDPDAFQAYHEGYRQQINKWPLNPLDVIIADISKLFVLIF